MYVFELYARRLAKRKMLLAWMVMIPLLLAFLLAKTYEPSQVDEFTGMMSSMIGILVIVTLLSTTLFYRDKQHKTAQRIYLSTQSKLSFYAQMVAVYLAISLLQLLAMILAVERLLPVGLSLELIDYIILFSAYCLLIIIATGLGLLVMNRSRSRNGGSLKLTAIGLALLLMYGILGTSIELPIMLRSVANVVPTYWLTEVIAIIFDDISLYTGQLLLYMVSLLLCAGLILMLLSRTKTEKL